MKLYDVNNSSPSSPEDGIIQKITQISSDGYFKSSYDYDI